MRFTRFITVALLCGALACSHHSEPLVDRLEPATSTMFAIRKNLVSVDVTPAQVSVVAGGTQQFSANGRRSDGSVIALTPTWTATGGTISAGGLYAAGQAAGTFRVVASSGNLADTSVVTLTVTSPISRTLTALVLAPAAVSLTAGATQQFSATASWSDGSTSTGSATWTASGGTVSGSGLYTAGGTGGAFTVVATSGGKADTSMVTVTASTSSSTSADFLNAPGTGWSTIASLTWSQPIPFRQDPIYDADNGSHLVDWGDDDPNAKWGRQAVVVSDASTPGPAASSLELRLPTGLTGGYGASKVGNHPNWTGSGPLWWPASMNTGHLYVGMWVKFSPNFTLNGNVGQKIFYLKSDLAPNAGLNHMIGLMVNDGNGGNQLWPAYEPQNPTNRYSVPATTTNNLNDGRWHQLEYLQLPNTPGTANGTLKIWVDGRLEISLTNAMFFDGTQVASVNRLEINPIYGGGTHPVPVNEWIRLGPVLVKIR